jgi:hypothetical protein
MNQHADDPLAKELAHLPDDPLDPRAAAAVLRHARGVLEEEGRLIARLLRLWTGVLLPAVLLTCAVVYTWGAVQTIEAIYVAGR